jgi:hypothetical protein
MIVRAVTDGADQAALQAECVRFEAPDRRLRASLDLRRGDAATRAACPVQRQH